MGTMSSRREEKERLRADRETREQEATAAATRRRRLGMLGGALLAAAAIVVALILISSGGSSKGNGGSAGRPLEHVAEVNNLFKGIPQSGRVLGRSDAPVTMVEFADLQCPFCAQYAQDALPTVVSRYVRAGKVKLELRLIAIIGPDSGKARRMAAAAQRQNRLWNFAELFYRNQGEENSGYVTDPFLRLVASSVPGLDVNRAFSDRNSAAVQALLADNDAGASARSVNSTPTFFAGRSGQSLAQLNPSSLDASGFTGPLDQLLKG
jgi:protein-disulfide isomerase